MTSFMHFIGKSYYPTIGKFVQEARRCGITRRVSPNVLKNMTWNDEILCLQREGRNKAYSMFLLFPITRIVGISKQVLEMLGGKVVQFSDEEEQIERECGSYQTEGTYRVEMPISDIGHELYQFHKQGVDIGKPMIGCYADDISYMTEPYPKIGGFSQKMGFRPYNAEKLWSELNMRICTGKRKLLHGTYYLAAEAGDYPEGLVSPVKDYFKREEMKVPVAQLELI